MGGAEGETMKQQKDSLIKNATTGLSEQWELPKPNLRPGAEDFLKVPSLRGERRVAHAPARGMVRNDKM